MREIIRGYFPLLNEFHFLQDLEDNCRVVEFPEGDVIMKYGKPLSYIYLLFEGSVRINRINEEGEEVFLYYLVPGDMCAVSFVSASRGRLSQVSAVALEGCKVISIPVSRLDNMSLEHKCWHVYTMDTLHSRFDELLSVIDSIAFKNLEERILEYLEKTCFSYSSHEIKITHNDIAAALHTSREVVSRLMKKLEAEGKVKLYRNNIDLLCYEGYTPHICPLHCDKSHRNRP